MSNAKLDRSKLDEFSLIQFSSAQFCSNQLNSAEFSRIQLNSAQFSSIQPNSAQFNSAQLLSLFDQFWTAGIELLNNKLHGLSPPGGLVSPSAGFASLLFDQVLHFASIILCQASWM
jgi:uncharacterized protein YjbI with pentapeptide repeats